MPELPAHERPPRYRVLRIPPYRREPDRILVEDKEAGIEQSWNVWTGGVLDGLAKEEPYDALVDRLQARWPERSREKCEAVLRRFFYTLHRMKVVELHLDAPATFSDGRYQVVKELGRGGVGVAWLCTDAKAPGREVVVKRAWDYFAPLARTDALMRGEVDVMRRLDHPGIAKPYDAFEEGGLLHLVREFARGQELSSWRNVGVQPAPVRRKLAREIVDIVAHLHARDFLLLDLRPANFFVEPSTMRAMLIDVGHCKEMRGGVVDLGVPPKGKAHGSPGFAAPETSTEGRAWPATDVWGFGRLYSFMVTGHLPKQGMTTQELLARMETLGAPADERAIVAACAEDARENRVATMRDAATLLAHGQNV